MELRFSFWPDWRIEDTDSDLIGTGSFGKVYRICRNDFGKKVVSALKIIHLPRDSREIRELEDSGMDRNSIQAYYDHAVQEIGNEIRAMIELKTAPNVVTIEDYHIEGHEIGYTVYIRMQLLKSLEAYAHEHTSNGRTFSEQEVVRLGQDLCNALIFCEEKRIIHRDIKPANVFLDEYKNFVLGDFGVARQLESISLSMHSLKGTPLFMAPEILLGYSYDKTADIYAVGIMLYRYLNHNRNPFEPAYPAPLLPDQVARAMQRRIAGEEIPLPDDASVRIGKIVCKACNANPAKRFQTALEMNKALSQSGLMNTPDGNLDKSDSERIIFARTHHKERDENDVADKELRKTKSTVLIEQNDIEESAGSDSTSFAAINAAKQRDIKSSNNRTLFNRNLRKISIGLVSFPQEEPRAKYWICIHEPEKEDCVLAKTGYVNDLEDCNLRNLLDEIEREKDITIAEVSLVALPATAGIQARLFATSMCVKAGLGKPKRILRMPSLEVYGYVQKCNFFNVGEEIEVQGLFIRIERNSVDFTRFCFGEYVTEIISCHHVQLQNNSTFTVLEKELSTIQNESSSLQPLPSRIIVCCDFYRINKCVDKIQSIFPKAEIKTTELDSAAIWGAGALDAFLHSKANKPHLLLDITTLSYEIRTAESGKVLIRLNAGSTVPVQVFVTLYAKHAYSEALIVYENEKQCGVLNASTQSALAHAEIRLVLEIDANGNIHWWRESVKNILEEDKQLAQIAESAALMYENKNYHEEYHLLKKALELAPYEENLLNRMGRCGLNIGDYSCALQHYRTVQRYYPDHPSGYVNEGVVWLIKREYSKALSLFRQGIELLQAEPQYTTISRAGTIYANAARAAYSIDRAQAETWMEMAERAGYNLKDLKKSMRFWHKKR